MTRQDITTNQIIDLIIDKEIDVQEELLYTIRQIIPKLDQSHKITRKLQRMFNNMDESVEDYLILWELEKETGKKYDDLKDQIANRETQFRDKILSTFYINGVDSCKSVRLKKKLESLYTSLDDLLVTIEQLHSLRTSFSNVEELV
uniref:ORF19 n=1 Tax=Nitrosopumilaceae spindle-shaped virus TaxID=3065433 RepID=A0AAT9J7C2_9VIRU